MCSTNLFFHTSRRTCGYHIRPKSNKIISIFAVFFFSFFPSSYYTQFSFALFTVCGPFQPQAEQFSVPDTYVRPDWKKKCYILFRRVETQNQQPNSSEFAAAIEFITFTVPHHHPVNSQPPLHIGDAAQTIKTKVIKKRRSHRTKSHWNFPIPSHKRAAATKSAICADLMPEW